MDEPLTEGAAAPPRRALSRRARFLGAVIALLALAGLGWLAWDLTHQPAASATAGAQGARPGGGGGGRGGPGAGGGAPPTTVGIAKAELSSIPLTIEALGTVTPVIVTVRPQVSGVLKEVHYREGQIVKAGDLLATIDSRMFEMAVQQATGQRLRDEAQLDAARVTLQRYQTLLSQDSIARQDVDTQAALVKQLEGSVVTDRANEGTARINLGYTRIVAPISGRVGLRVVDIGNLINSSDANGIATITQLSPISVEFSIPQDRVPEVQERAASGAKLPVVALDRTRTNVLENGTFLTLDNVVDTQTGTVRAKASFPNTKLTLFPAQFVNVRLLLRTLEGAVTVPVTAVRHGSNGDYVYVLNEADRTVALRNVTRGQETPDKTVITSGLKAGETVITEGADRLKDGARVVLPGDQPGAGGSGQGRGNRGNRAAGKGGADKGAAGDAGSGDSPRKDGDNAKAGAATGNPDAASGRVRGGDAASGGTDATSSEGRRRRRPDQATPQQ